MHQLKIPRIWRRAPVIAIPKLEESLGDPKSYHLISLLCVPFRILEKLLYTCVKPIIDLLLLQEQVGFRHGKSTMAQVTLLTQDIQHSFLAKKKVELCLSISQQPTILYEITTSPASYCDCYLTRTWSA